MLYYKERYFRDYALKLTLNEQRIFSTREGRSADPADTRYDVFLSYNIVDQKVVMGIYYYLINELGLKVYIDCVNDPDLQRNATDKNSAERIQNRLKHSRSLLYAQSANANNSNWMPWELGVVDGHTGKCMIMPVTIDSEREVPKREYLLLYPYVRPNIDNRMRVYIDATSLEKPLVDYIK